MVETYTEQYKLTRDKINNEPVDLVGENQSSSYFVSKGGWAVDPTTYSAQTRDAIKFMGGNSFNEYGVSVKYGLDNKFGYSNECFKVPIVQDSNGNFCFKAPGYVKMHIYYNGSDHTLPYGECDAYIIENNSGMSDTDACKTGVSLFNLRAAQYTCIENEMSFTFEYFIYQIFTKPMTNEHFVALDRNKKKTPADTGTVLWSNTTPQTDMPILYLTEQQLNDFTLGGFQTEQASSIVEPYTRTDIWLGCYVSTTVTVDSGYSNLVAARTYGENNSLLTTKRDFSGTWAMGATIRGVLQFTSFNCSMTVQRTATLYSDTIAAITDLTAGGFEDVITFDISVPNTEIFHLVKSFTHSFTSSEHIFKHYLWKNQLDIYSSTSIRCPKYDTPVRPSNTIYITLDYNKTSDTLAEYSCSVNASAISSMVDDAAVSYTLTEWDTLGNRQILKQVDMTNNRIDETSGTVTIDPNQDYVSYIQAEVHVTVGGVETTFGKSMIVSVSSSEYPMYIMQDIDGIGFFAPPENGYVTMPYLNYTYDADDENPDVHIMILGAGFFAHSSGAIGFISWYGIPRPDCIGYGKAVWHTQMLNDNIIHPLYTPNFTIKRTAPMYDGVNHSGVEDSVDIKVVEIPMGGFYNDAKHTNCERSYYTTDYCKMHPGSGEAHNCFPCYIAGGLYYVDEAKLAASWQQIIDTSGAFVENYEKYCVDLNGSVKIDKEIMIV